MRNLALVLFCGYISIATAQNHQLSKPVVCAPTKVVISQLDSEWNEKLSWIGKEKDEQSSYSLFVNQKTKSWTIVQYNFEIACILGTGEFSTLITNPV